MSGGHFDYKQYEINNIADEIQGEIDRSGKERTTEELKERYGWNAKKWLEEYPEDRYNYKYPDDVITEFKKAVKILRKATIYAHRIDWLLSGDDGDNTFLERLNEELKEFE